MHDVDVILGLWFAEDGKTALIEAVSDDPRYPLRVTIAERAGGRPFPPSDVAQADAETLRLPARYVASGHPSVVLRGLEAIVVEAGVPGRGRTYDLFVAVAAEGGQWRRRRPDDPQSSLRLLPETSAGFADAVAFHDDEGYVPWAEPLTPYRRP